MKKYFRFIFSICLVFLIWFAIEDKFLGQSHDIFRNNVIIASSFVELFVLWFRRPSYIHKHKANKTKNSSKIKKSYNI